MSATTHDDDQSSHSSGTFSYHESPASRQANFHEAFELAFDCNLHYMVCNLEFDDDSSLSSAGSDDTAELIADVPKEPPKSTSKVSLTRATGDKAKPPLLGGRRMHRVRANYERLRPYFLHVPVHKVQKTFENTTQMAAYSIHPIRSSHVPNH